jgi:hypothetical protein
VAYREVVWEEGVGEEALTQEHKHYLPGMSHFKEERYHHPQSLHMREEMGMGILRIMRREEVEVLEVLVKLQLPAMTQEREVMVITFLLLVCSMEEGGEEPIIQGRVIQQE